MCCYNKEMLRRFLPGLIIVFVLFFSFPLFYVFNYSQPNQIDSNKVVYNLPYPGILPDSPLYPIKVARDRMLEFSTRDYIKKAQVYLLLSDKRLAMAVELSKKGKYQLSATTLSKAEKYALKIPNLLKTSKVQGAAACEEFVQQLKASNRKHQQTIQQLLKDVPANERESLLEVGDLNKQVDDQIQML